MDFSPLKISNTDLVNRNYNKTSNHTVNNTEVIVDQKTEISTGPSNANSIPIDSKNSENS